MTGSGRDSGRWKGVESAGVKDFIARLLLEAARRAARALLRPSEPKPADPEVAKLPETPEAEQQPNVDSNKLHHIFDKKGRELEEFLSNYSTEEDAFRAIEDATRAAVKEQNITGQYKIQIEIDGHKLGVAGIVMPDGTIKIGTAYPWKD